MSRQGRNDSVDENFLSRTHSHDTRRKLKKVIVLLSSLVPTRKRRRETNDFSPSFVQVIAAFVGQGSFFKIIRWKGSAAHQRSARTTDNISRWRFWSRYTASDYKIQKGERDGKRKTVKKREKRENSWHKCNRIYCARRDDDRVHFKSCPKSNPWITHAKVYRRPKSSATVWKSFCVSTRVVGKVSITNLTFNFRDVLSKLIYMKQNSNFLFSEILIKLEKLSTCAHL